MAKRQFKHMGLECGGTDNIFVAGGISWGCRMYKKGQQAIYTIYTTSFLKGKTACNTDIRIFNKLHMYNRVCAWIKEAVAM